MAQMTKTNYTGVYQLDNNRFCYRLNINKKGVKIDTTCRLDQYGQPFTTKTAARDAYEKAKAEAEKFKMFQEAEGIKARGEAEAAAVLAKGQAEAQAMKEKAEPAIETAKPLLNLKKQIRRRRWRAVAIAALCVFIILFTSFF